SKLDVKAHLGEPLAGNLEEIGGTARDAREEAKDRERYPRHRRVLCTANHDFVSDVIMHFAEIDLEAERLATPERCGNVRRLHETEPHLNAVDAVAKACDRMALCQRHARPPVAGKSHQ